VLYTLSNAPIWLGLSNYLKLVAMLVDINDTDFIVLMYELKRGELITNV
jgi:hypothetical protein